MEIGRSLPFAALAVGLLLVAPLGAHLAPSADEPGEVGMPRIGDRVRYEVTHATADGEHEGSFAFTWDGTARRTGPVGETRSVAVAEGVVRLDDAPRHRPFELTYRAGAVEPMTVSGNLNWSSSWEMASTVRSETSVEGGYRAFHGRSIVEQPLQRPLLHCTVRAGWQGRSLDGLEGAGLAEVCPAAAEPADRPGRLAALGVEEIGGLEAHRFEAALPDDPDGDAWADGGSVTVWLADGIAYPLRSEIATPEGTIRLDLAGIERGDRAIPAPEPDRRAMPDERPGVRFEEPGPWGVVEGDPSVFAFAPSEAIASIRADPRLDGFDTYREEHPAARVVAYGYYEGPLYSWAFGADGAQTRVWWFVWSSPSGDGYEVASVRPTGVRAGPASATLPASEEVNDAEPVDLPPLDRAKLPDRAVRLSDVLEAWRGSPLSERPVNNIVRPSSVYLFGAEDVAAWRPYRDVAVGHFDFGRVSLGDLPETTVRSRINLSGMIVELESGRTVSQLNMDLRQAVDNPAYPDDEDADRATPEGDAVPADGIEGIAAPAAGAGALLVALAVLYKLVQRGVVTLPLLSRIGRDEILDNPTRREVYEAIADEPGIHVNELLRTVDCGDGTLRYHLGVLVDQGFVTRIEQGGYTRFFLAGEYGYDEMRRLAVLRNGSLDEIYETIRRSPGLSQSGVAERCGLTEPAIHRAVETLVEHGLVERERQGRSVALFPAAEA